VLGLCAYFRPPGCASFPRDLPSALRRDSFKTALSADASATCAHFDKKGFYIFWWFLLGHNSFPYAASRSSSTSHTRLQTPASIARVTRKVW